MNTRIDLAARQALQALAYATHGTCEQMGEIVEAHAALDRALSTPSEGRCSGCPGGRCMCARQKEPWTREKPTEADMRAAFEAWALPRAYRCEWWEADNLSATGYYSDSNSQSAWLGWRAAMAGA